MYELQNLHLNLSNGPEKDMIESHDKQFIFVLHCYENNSGENL